MRSGMSYAQARAFLEEAKAYGSVLGLDSIRALMHELSDVWKDLNIAHVAGTNGKGSVCCFLSSALREAGYRTGQFNSPAVFGCREVYRVNGQEISREEYAACMEQVATACGRMKKKGLAHPTVFELETALAFLWFSRKKCDIVILEAGMGGGTDATNLIERPLCSIFTPVGMDHTNYLGNSLAEIASVKAGIIKKNCPVISARQKKEAREQLFTQARKAGASYDEVPEIGEARLENGRLSYRHPKLGELSLSMTGAYQAENSAIAIQALERLKELGFPCTDEQVRRGIELARWPGRFERVGRNPLFYIDGAHNAEAAVQLKESLLKLDACARRIGIMGVMEDKPYEKMLDTLLPLFEQIHVVKPDKRRALPPEILAGEISRRGGRAVIEASVKDAVLHARDAARGQGDFVVAFGSLYYLKEVTHALYEISA